MAIDRQESSARHRYVDAWNRGSKPGPIGASFGNYNVVIPEPTLFRPTHN